MSYFLGCLAVLYHTLAMSPDTYHKCIQSRKVKSNSFASEYIRGCFTGLYLYNTSIDFSLANNICTKSYWEMDKKTDLFCSKNGADHTCKQLKYERQHKKSGLGGKWIN